MTKIIGGYGVYQTMNLKGSVYVDVGCIELTRQSNCVFVGTTDPSVAGSCSHNLPIDDYAKDGIDIDIHTSHLTLQDIWIHGHPHDGLNGTFKDVLTLNRVIIEANGNAGYNGDNGCNFGQGDPDCNGAPNHVTGQPFGSNATMYITGSAFLWNGCNQEYPYKHPIPIESCTDQNHGGGYGDAWATPEATGLNVYVDHTFWAYNTQEAFDGLHVDGGGAYSVSFTNNVTIGNMGQSFKVGGNFTTQVVSNNLFVNNCDRMKYPIAGAPSYFNTPESLGYFCRAGDALVAHLVNGAHSTWTHNTVLSTAPTAFDIQCSDSSCDNTVLTIADNIVVGFTQGGGFNENQTPGQYYFDGPSLSNHFTQHHNLFLGFHSISLSTGDVSADPQFVNRALKTDIGNYDPFQFDNLNLGLSASSPAKGAGAVLTGTSTDITGAAYATPPSMGALEYGSSYTTPVNTALYAAVASPLIPSDFSGTPGGTATFTAAIDGNPVITSGQWYRIDPGQGAGSAIGGATALTYTRTGLSTSDNGAKYYFTGGGATTRQALLTTYVPPPTTNLDTSTDLVDNFAGNSLDSTWTGGGFGVSNNSVTVTASNSEIYKHGSGFDHAALAMPSVPNYAGPAMFDDAGHGYGVLVGSTGAYLVRIDSSASNTGIAQVGSPQPGDVWAVKMFSNGPALYRNGVYQTFVYDTAYTPTHPGIYGPYNSSSGMGPFSYGPAAGTTPSSTTRSYTGNIGFGGNRTVP